MALESRYSQFNFFCFLPNDLAKMWFIFNIWYSSESSWLLTRMMKRQYKVHVLVKVGITGLSLTMMLMIIASYLSLTVMCYYYGLCDLGSVLPLCSQGSQFLPATRAYRGQLQRVYQQYWCSSWQHFPQHFNKWNVFQAFYYSQLVVFWLQIVYPLQNTHLSETFYLFPHLFP